jgi:hypothetical protein
MTIHFTVPLIVAVVGLILHFAVDGKVSSAGLWAWGAGLTAFLIR